MNGISWKDSPATAPARLIAYKTLRDGRGIRKGAAALLRAGGHPLPASSFPPTTLRIRDRPCRSARPSFPCKSATRSASGPRFFYSEPRATLAKTAIDGGCVLESFNDHIELVRHLRNLVSEDFPQDISVPQR